MERGGKKGKGKKKKNVACVGKANIWKKHDKDYARTYKMYIYL